MYTSTVLYNSLLNGAVLSSKKTYVTNAEHLHENSTTLTINVNTNMIKKSSWY